ncbi:SMI1/KNR4 family protein [Orbaceae bacterium ESL0721]|nr:SMI1/KNR4 family protein [Orbaceae bacterium ESL0721]
MSIIRNINAIGTLSNRDIEHIENELKISFPDDYKQFLVNYNGGSVELNESNQLAIDGLSEKVTIDVLYGINTGYDNANIDFWTDKLKEDLLPETIIIGDSIMHGFFVMICSGELKGIYYWDDTYYFETSNDEGNTYWIASTFTEFMQLWALEV